MKCKNDHEFDSHALPPISQQNSIIHSVWNQFEPIVRTDPRADSCHSHIHNAIYRRKLKKQPCVNCGSGKDLMAHHPDYSKPMSVVWLCRKCHREEHLDIKYNNFLENFLEYSFYIYHMKGADKQRQVSILRNVSRHYSGFSF